MSHLIDVSALLEQLKAELRAELLDELHATADATAWPQFMSLERAAAYLDHPVERLRKLVATRQIPFIQQGPGCRIFFNRNDLDTWMNHQRQTGHP